MSHRTPNRSASQQRHNTDNARGNTNYTPRPKRKAETIDLTGGDDDDDDDDDKQSHRSSKTPRITQSRNWPTPSQGQYSSSPARWSQQSRPTLGFQPSFSSPGDIVGNSHSQAERDSWLTAAPEDDNDINEVVSSTQDAAIGTEELVLYGNLDTKIVGCRFYNGIANPGECVLIRREPGNPYDSNAIRIDNMFGNQIGHIGRQVAAKLAKYFDRQRLFFEGIISGDKGHYDCPVRLRMYGPPAGTPASREIVDMLRQDRLPLDAIRDRQAEVQRKLAEERKKAAKKGRTPSGSQPEFAASQTDANGEKPKTMDEIMEASERFSPRNLGQTAEQLGHGEDYLAAMPQADAPARISTEMLPYQRQALAWLLEKENPRLPPSRSKDTVQLWKRHERNPGALVNIATNFAVRESEITLASGGILADDMGLGKTLEMISLIVADLGNKRKPDESSATLVVAPLSVISNWSDQIARHVQKDQPLRVYIYHAGGRDIKMQPGDFDQYDVVITTYQTLASDFMPRSGGNAGPVPRKSGLYSVQWRRILLDEGHIIRNPQAKVALACTAVLARSRWVLTGTPIINSLKDLYSVLRFIGITGGPERLEIFNSVLVRPLKSGSESATFLLQAIMSELSLRRRKDMSFIDLRLPELSEYVNRVQFSAHESERYNALLEQARGRLHTYQHVQGQKAADSYRHLLEVLLRLRQVCNHWHLAKERVSGLMEALGKSKTVELTPENRKALQDMLQLSIESREDCPICLEGLHKPVITHCAHVFGGECITRVIETQHKCPMCRAELKDETRLVEPANDYGDENKDEQGDELDLDASSSKLEALTGILKASKPGSKTVIFSQWTKFLDIVQARLDREGHRYCRIDGTMPAAKRDAALHALEHDPACTVMLASLGVCAVGLNLVAANQIILSDTWWAPAIEDQAVDRVHRLGQKKPTTVFRLVVEGSVEERTLDIQKDKRKLMMLAYGERKSKRDGGKAARMADIQKLLA